MPYLLYCVTEAGAATPPSTGVCGAAVESADSSGLRCFYSLVDVLASDPESVKRDALEFHRVIHELFRQAAIIPFRFPTVLSSQTQIDAHLQERSAAYRAALEQFRGTVQMEVRIGLAGSPGPADTSSGAKYLKSRAQRARHLEQAVAACRAAIQQEVIDWRQRESSPGVRCFFLVRREAADRFQQQISQVRLHQTLTAALSGPWPPTEFLPVFS